MSKYYIWTIGCQMNVADSDRLESALSQLGLQSAQAPQDADVIVLNSNPLDDIRNTLDMRWVMKEGRLYDAETLDEIWPRVRPYGPRPWVNPDALRNDVRGSTYWENR